MLIIEMCNEVNGLDDNHLKVVIDKFVDKKKMQKPVQP